LPLVDVGSINGTGGDLDENLPGVNDRSFRFAHT
jgi:hypothetical protein